MAEPYPREWDASAYHRLADPQFAWGMKVLDRLTLRGDEVVVDAGCGSGRLTEALMERLPRGRVIAVDASENMLREARHTLARFGNRVRYLAADLAGLALPEPVDVVFSTATFHWIGDHEALFRALFACLVPEGRLHAQCGGGPNLARIHARAQQLMAEPDLAPCFRGFRGPWNFEDAQTTRERLERLGFVEVVTSLELAPTVFDDRTRYKEFLRTVILRAHLAQIPDAALSERFLERMTCLGEGDTQPLSLDYVRLNLSARRPQAR